MSVCVTRPVLVEPIVDHSGGNTTDARGIDRYYGWSTSEALDAACQVGSLYAWEWLQAWWGGELDEDDKGPDGEEV